MDAISFIFKTTLVTIAVILVMQIKWGGQTIERHTMRALTSAQIVRPLNETAHGAATLVRNVWDLMWYSKPTKHARD